jgi:DNA gyrase subunit A
LTACEHGYGKRTPIGPNGAPEEEKAPIEDEDETAGGDETQERGGVCPPVEPPEEPGDGDDIQSSMRYATKSRATLGLVSIKMSARNGPVIGTCRVRDGDEVMMITAQGQIQRIAVTDIRVMGRSTQGVRLMNLDKGDTLVAIKRIPKIEGAAESNGVEAETEPQS